LDIKNIYELKAIKYLPTHLVAHLHFFPKHKAKQKNAKEPTSKRTTTRQTMNQTTTTDRRAACNSTYPKGGVSCSKDSFVVNQTLVFQIKFCGKSPALRVAAKRYR
jgi:hypothetical protein